MAIHSLCSLVNDRLVDEFKILYRSLRLTGNLQPFYLLTDQKAATSIRKEFGDDDPNLKLDLGLEEWSGQTRSGMEAGQKFTEFLLKKTVSIRNALHHHPNTLFIDSDMVFFAPLSPIDLEAAVVALAPHHIKKSDAEAFGYYNAGYLAVKDPDFLDWWLEAARTGPEFLDQGCLVHAPKHFSTSEIPIQQNFGYWRVFQAPDPQKRLKKFRVDKEGIFYEDLPLVSAHTHLLNRGGGYNRFNRLIEGWLRKSGRPEHSRILEYIMQKKYPELENPRQPEAGKGGQKTRKAKPVKKGKNTARASIAKKLQRKIRRRKV